MGNPIVMPGTRIRLTYMPDDPSPVEEGAIGTVRSVVPISKQEFQIHVDWDNGRTLSLVTPPDRFELV